MAQSGLRSFYPVRRRREDDTQTAIKRRKLTPSSHLEVPAATIDKQLDSSDFTDGDTSSLASTKKPTVRSRKGGGRAATKKSQSGKGKRCKKKGETADVPNSKTLFEIVNQAMSVKTGDNDDEAPSTANTSNEDRFPFSHPVASQPSQRNSQQSQKTATKSSIPPYQSPFKVPAIPHGGDSSSRTSTPKSSPAKMATAVLSPATLSRSPAATSSPVPESRGARLIRMAKEKMATKSPNSKVASSATIGEGSSYMAGRRTRMAARRKLLAANSDLPSSATSGSSASKSAASIKFFSSVEHDRQEMVGELFKLSKRELAQPTRYEGGNMKSRTSGSCSSSGDVGGEKKEREEEESGVKTPKIREFGAFEFVSPTKSEAAKTRLPAYQKFHALAEPAAPSVTTPTPKTPLPSATPPVELPLPYSYQLLEEKFRCTDTVVSMLQKRKEICTFEKLKKAVQEMSRRQFEEKNLGQMKTVYPTAFNFRQEKNIPGLFDQRNKYHLTVECSVEEDKRKNSPGETKKGETKSTKGALNATMLITRRKKFNRNLTEIAKKHHKVFLASLKPPLHIPDEKILRWHPAFALDSVPEVEAAPLPAPPIKETYTTAKDLLNVAQDRLTERVQAALANASDGGVGKSEAGDPVEAREGERRVQAVAKREESGVTNPELRGVSLALLEKIQAKEAARAKLAITRDPVKERQLEMLSRLPDFVRIVRGFFVTEKKAALPREDVVKKLVDSHPSRLPPDKVETHLKYLMEVLPEWVKSVKVSKGVFIKVDKKIDLKTITAKLDRTKNSLAKQ